MPAKCRQVSLEQFFLEFLRCCSTMLQQRPAQAVGDGHLHMRLMVPAQVSP